MNKTNHKFNQNLITCCLLFRPHTKIRKFEHHQSQYRLKIVKSPNALDACQMSWIANWSEINWKIGRKIDISSDQKEMTTPQMVVVYIIETVTYQLRESNHENRMSRSNDCYGDSAQAIAGKCSKRCNRSNPRHFTDRKLTGL